MFRAPHARHLCCVTREAIHQLDLHQERDVKNEGIQSYTHTAIK
jgi:hypothetical protein